MEWGAAIRNLRGKSRQIKISPIVEHMEEDRRIEASIAVSEIAEEKGGEENGGGPKGRVGPEVHQREEKGDEQIRAAYSEEGALPPPVLGPGPLKKAAKENLFKPGLPNNEKKEGDRENLVRGHRSERLSLSEKKPEQAGGAEGEQKGEIFVKRGKGIETDRLDEFTHYKFYAL